MNIKYLFLFCGLLTGLLTSCGGDSDEPNGGGNEKPVPPAVSGGDVAYLTDGSLERVYEAEGANVTFTLERTGALRSYALYSADAKTADADPMTWTLSGSNDQHSWILIDQQRNVDFGARFQEQSFSLPAAVTYKFLKFEIQPRGEKRLRIAEIKLSEKDMNEGWHAFSYPIIQYQNQDPSSDGSKYYDYLVANKEAYLKYHAREVAKQLYFTADDARKDLQMITYVLKNFNGISAKSGNVPSVKIEYSTSYIANTYRESMAKLDFETRGVLYHEMTHCYQYEPKGIGSYQEPNLFWCFVEGLADAVRIHAGYISKENRRPGGWYTDGYQRTGFFLDWLTTKDPDAIRKFNKSATLLDTWSFDGAMEYIFGKGTTTKSLWDEYQAFLNANG